MENNLEIWCKTILEMHFEVNIRIYLVFYTAHLLTIGSNHSETNSTACSCILDVSAGYESRFHVECPPKYSHDSARRAS